MKILSEEEINELAARCEGHYPEPWEADGGIIRMKDSGLIARMFEAGEFPCLDFDSEADELRFESEYAANATLLAAAPSLLDTCLDLVEQNKVLREALGKLHYGDAYMRERIIDAALTQVQDGGGK